MTYRGFREGEEVSSQRRELIAYAPAEVKSGAENAVQQGGKSFLGGRSARSGAVNELPRKFEENKLAEVS